MTEKELIPFNLERALAGDPIVTRDGRKVLQIAYFPIAAKDNQIVALIEHNEYLSHYHRDGSYYSEKSAEDLFMAQKTKTYWVNIYKHENNKIHCGEVYSSKERAENSYFDYSSHSLFIKTISFEVEG
jgi:hypothetical protein